MSTIASAQYDPPSGYTTYYKLRMWDEGDRPGADSINQNLKDIDYILKTGVIHPTGFEILPGQKRFTNKIEIGTPGSSLSTDSANKVWNRTFFMNEAPRCVYNPDNTASLTNKSYVDGAITTAAANYVHLSGTEYITGAKTFTGVTTSFGDDAQGDSYLNIIATDNAKISFNGVTFLTWDAVSLTVGGFVNATGYKVSGTTMYLSTGYGEKNHSDYYVSSSPGGSTNTGLNAVPVTINGVTYNLLVKE